MSGNVSLNNTTEVSRLTNQLNIDKKAAATSAESQATAFENRTQTSDTVQFSRSEVTTTSVAADMAESTFQTLNNELTELRNSITDLSGQLEGEVDEATINDVKSKIEAKKQEIETKEKEVQTARENADISKSEAMSAEATLKRAESDLAKAEIQLKQAEGKAQTDSIKVTTTEAELKTAETKAAEEAKAAETKKTTAEEIKTGAESLKSEFKNSSVSDPEQVKKVMDSADKLFPESVTTGKNYCAKGVNDILEDAGIVGKNETRSLHAKDVAGKLSDHPSFKQVYVESEEDIAKLGEGYVCIYDADGSIYSDGSLTPFGESGHACITKGQVNGVATEVSDHNQAMKLDRTHGGKSGFSVFAIVDPEKEAALDSEVTTKERQLLSGLELSEDAKDTRSGTVSNRTGASGLEEAVRLRCEANGSKPVYVDGDGKPIYDRGDEAAARFELCAGQPSVVANAKQAEELIGKFNGGTASDKEVQDTIDIIRNGNSFADSRGTRSAGDILTSGEQEVLIGKLKEGKQLTPKEQIALTYLDGTTDKKGFPTVDDDLDWGLPEEPVDNSKGIEVKNATDIIFNFNSDAGKVKLVADEGTPEYEFLTTMSKGFAPTAGPGRGNSDNAIFREIRAAGTQFPYYNGTVKYNDLYEAAKAEGLKTSGSNYKFNAEIALKHGLISQEQFDSLSEEARSVTFELHAPTAKPKNGPSTGEPMYSASALTTIGNSRDDIITTRDIISRDIANNPDHFSVRGTGDFGGMIGASSKFAPTTDFYASTTVLYVNYYDGTVGSDGKPVIKTVPTTNSQLVDFKAKAAEGYAKLQQKGLVP